MLMGVRSEQVMTLSKNFRNVRDQQNVYLYSTHCVMWSKLGSNSFEACENIKYFFERLKVVRWWVDVSWAGDRWVEGSCLQCQSSLLHTRSQNKLSPCSYTSLSASLNPTPCPPIIHLSPSHLQLTPGYMEDSGTVLVNFCPRCSV